MSRLRGWWSQFRGLFARRHRDADWAAELESHIELHIADNIMAGMSPIEARRQALIKLGGVEPVKEALRSQGTIEWIESVAQDVRYACRMMRRNPGFATTAILSLALGLGSSLAVFTVADNLLLRPLPYPGASQLVMVGDANPQRGIDHNVISPGNFLDWKAQNDVFEAMAGLRESRSVLIDGDRAEEFGKQSVSAEFFEMLRIKPHRGRVFTAQEELESRSSDSLILISHRLWQNWFGGDERVIGAGCK